MIILLSFMYLRVESTDEWPISQHQYNNIHNKKKKELVVVVVVIIILSYLFQFCFHLFLSNVYIN
jgi:uncharacterized membrane protein affecting hemolysin expression